MTSPARTSSRRSKPISHPRLSATAETRQPSLIFIIFRADAASRSSALAARSSKGTAGILES
jgi:hypothetical protein